MGRNLLYPGTDINENNKQPNREKNKINVLTYVRENNQLNLDAYNEHLNIPNMLLLQQIVKGSSRL